MTPRVSIGLPVYNGERFLPDALRSVQEQDLEDIEIVLSDNGSTDGTEEIARTAAAADPRVRYLRSATNRGGAWNYMHVARASRGELFMWMAADDVKAPQFLSSCVQALDDAGPEVVLACPRTSLVDRDDVVFEQLNDTHMGMDAATAHQRVRNLLRSQASHVMYGVIRMDVLRTTRGLLPMVGDDMVLLTELLCRGRMALVDEQLFLQRRHRGQLSHQGHKQVMWHAPDAHLRFAFPQTKLDAELYRAVGLAPLPIAEKALCWAALGPSWVLPRWRGVARDLATAVGVVGA